MTTNTLAELDVDASTVKRAQYEAFEFDPEAPGLLQVTNGSYGDDEKSAHSYRVKDVLLKFPATFQYAYPNYTKENLLIDRGIR